MAKDFLLEVGTEELPPKALASFINHIKQTYVDQLEQQGLKYAAIKGFATPRRQTLL